MTYLIENKGVCLQKTGSWVRPSGPILTLHSGGFGSLIRRAPYDGQITAWLVQVRLRLPSGDLALQGTHRLILRHQCSTAQPDAFSAPLSPRKTRFGEVGRSRANRKT